MDSDRIAWILSELHGFGSNCMDTERIAWSFDLSANSMDSERIVWIRSELHRFGANCLFSQRIAWIRNENVESVAVANVSCTSTLNMLPLLSFRARRR